MAECPLHQENLEKFLGPVEPFCGGNLKSPHPYNPPLFGKDGEVWYSDEEYVYDGPIPPDTERDNYMDNRAFLALTDETLRGVPG